MVFYKDNPEKFRVFDGDTFELYESFHSRKRAKLKGEEFKLSNDARRYRVTENDNGVYLLWLH